MLFGVVREHVREVLARHAAEVHVIVVDKTETVAMDEVVGAARSLAQRGDNVLLPRGCSAKNMYSGYDAKGDAFAVPVRHLLEIG